ncbi:MAG TPA: SHOCT domain-containing protein [Acidimicrobiales bacterium]|nr:SHOCT domain-containing protein [Acidimicrobiales bacterium]
MAPAREEVTPMMWWDGDGGWGPWVAMTFIMLAFWGVVIWAVVSVVRSAGAGRARDAEDVLAERFARGEIDEDEFRRRREVLRGQR